MSMASKLPTVERRVFMGIGDAVLRLIHVERMYADGVDPGEYLVAERELIVQALNQQYQLDLGMDCDMDGIPDAIDDDVSVLTTAAKTDCCRILPAKGGQPTSSRVEPLPSPSAATADPAPPKPRPKKSSSRKRATAAAKKAAAPTKKKVVSQGDAPPKKRRSSRKAAPKKPAPTKAAAKKAAPKKPATPAKKKGLLSSIFGSDEEN